MTTIKIEQKLADIELMNNETRRLINERALRDTQTDWFAILMVSGGLTVAAFGLANWIGV